MDYIRCRTAASLMGIDPTKVSPVRHPVAMFVCAAIIVGCVSCAGGGGGNDEDGTLTTFTAFGKDFAGYHGWAAYDVTADADLAGIHDGSMVTEYVNKVPSGGLSEFPVATIIVKEASGGTLPHELFAMVKRGGDYNSALQGWEWFELQNLDDGTDRVRIVWRGFGPPDGESYGGDVGSGCNTCHLACDNDAVCATPLKLTNF
jgi:hypothetical protein